MAGSGTDTIYLGNTAQADGATYDNSVTEYTASQLSAFTFMAASEGTAAAAIESTDTQNTDVADVADAGAGADTIYGEEGTDIIFGNDGADTIKGGTGRDALRGGAGDDNIYGGAGADAMRGDSGADTFFYESGDEIFPDTVDTSDTDIIMDFQTDADYDGSVETDKDILDLSDLLEGESETAASLGSYLDFNFSNGDTTIDIDVDGDGSGTDMSIKLEDVDLTNSGALTDAQIIQNLLDNNSLNTDP